MRYLLLQWFDLVSLKLYYCLLRSSLNLKVKSITCDKPFAFVHENDPSCHQIFHLLIFSKMVNHDKWDIPSDLVKGNYEVGTYQWKMNSNPRPLTKAQEIIFSWNVLKKSYFLIFDKILWPKLHLRNIFKSI